MLGRKDVVARPAVSSWTNVQVDFVAVVAATSREKTGCCGNACSAWCRAEYKSSSRSTSKRDLPRK